jgi:hypothetical protein
MRRTPEGLNARVCGVNAEMLYMHLNQVVSLFAYRETDYFAQILFRGQVAQSAESCKLVIFLGLLISCG